MRRLVTFAVVALVLGMATIAYAGARTTRIGVLNLDKNPKAKRFGYFKAGLESAIKAGAGGVIVGVVVIPETSVAPFLRPDCGLAMPAEEWQKIEKAVGAKGSLDFLVLYCADSSSKTLTWNVFEAASTMPFMSVTLRPVSDSVGRPAVNSLARAILEFSQMRFVP